MVNYQQNKNYKIGYNLTGNVYFERSGPAPIKIFRVTFTLHLDFLSNLIGGCSKFSTN